MGRSKNTWRGSMGRPPFEAGDWVRPNGNYPYQGWKDRAPRRVEAVNYDEMSDRWTLEIKNPMSPWNGYSNYTPRNMEHVSSDRKILAAICNATEIMEMATERKKFVGVKLNHNGFFEGGLSNGLGDASELLATSPMNSQHEVRVEIAKHIKHGDRWLVLQTVCLIEGEEPRPPIRVTDYA